MLSKIIIFGDGKTQTKYKNWLLKRCNLGIKNYSRLFNTLLRLPFITVMIEDKNREKDGLILRRKFKETDSPCSILEMLIALSIRINDEWVGIPNDPRPDIIFIEIINNLGLLEFTNNNFNEIEIENIIERFNLRQYEPNGTGGIFPLKNSDTDQTKVPIWNQMTAYIHENKERLIE